jgi:hypothetical protein
MLTPSSSSVMSTELPEGSQGFDSFSPSAELNVLAKQLYPSIGLKLRARRIVPPRRCGSANSVSIMPRR